MEWSIIGLNFTYAVLGVMLMLGARGLMQLVPSTFREIRSKNPERQRHRETLEYLRKIQDNLAALDDKGRIRPGQRP